MTRTATGTWADAIAARPAARPDAPWLAALRARTAAAFSSSGLPTPRDEDWRHTDLREVAGGTFEPPPPADGDEASRDLERARALLERLGGLGEAPRPHAVLVNGRPVPALGAAGGPGAGVEVVSLAAALEAGRADGLEDRLGRLADGAGHPFAALNGAAFEDALVVRVGRNADPEGPLHLAFLGLDAGRATVAHPRVLLLLEEGARLAVVETWTGETEKAPWLGNAVVEAFLGANARLDLLEIQDQPPSAFHVRAFEARLERDAHLATACLSMGGRLARNDVHVRLDAPGTFCRLDGLTLATGEQHVDHVTRVDHASPQGTSQQLYKGILDGRATTAFAGLVLVEPDAQKTDARQANHNLLLSPDAVADSKPQLEIFADDVKCAHGATVGQLDEQAIFYLRSRGLGLDAARMLLVEAFAGEVPERIENASLQAIARSRLALRLPGGR